MECKELPDQGGVSVLTTDAGQQLQVPAEAVQAIQGSADALDLPVSPDQDGRTSLTDPNAPEGGRPIQQPQPLFYGGNTPAGDNPNGYLSVQFDDGEVVIRDAADPTGKALKVPHDEWHRFIQDLSGGDGGDGRTGQSSQPRKATGRAKTAAERSAGTDKTGPDQ